MTVKQIVPLKEFSGFYTTRIAFYFNQLFTKLMILGIFTQVPTEKTVKKR